MRQSPHGVSYEAHRPVVMGRRGMVASGHPLASQAGIAVLQRGGNAVDAAVAVAAAVSVVEPGMSGIGGDGFIMLYHRARNELNVVNATGAAPGAATRERYLPGGIPMKGLLSMSVPGLLRGWVEAHRRYGALTLAQVLEPAIDLAENGFPVSHTLSASIAADTLLCEFPTSRAVFTRDGRPLAPGEVLYQRNLARTFQRIAAEGDGVFYEGEIGRALVRFSEEQGGLLTLQDLATCRARWQEPIATTYRGYTVYEAPPNSSGHVPAPGAEPRGAVRPLRPGLQHRRVHSPHDGGQEAGIRRPGGLPRGPRVRGRPHPRPPLEGVRTGTGRLHRPGASGRARAGWRRLALPGRRRAAPGALRVGTPQEDTTCFVVVDGDGNAVSQLQSLQSGSAPASSLATRASCSTTA